MEANEEPQGTGPGGRQEADEDLSGGQQAKVNVNPAERVASVAVGAVLLARGLRRPLGRSPWSLAGSALVYRGISGHSYLYKALGVKTTGEGAPSQGASPDALEVQRTITVRKSPEEIYHRWRDPGTISQVLGHAVDVSEAGPGRMRWTLRAPAGRTLEWETEFVEDRPGELLRWQSLPGAGLANEGWVRLRPAPRDQGTEVTVHVRYDPPGGRLGRGVVKAMRGAPRLLVAQALHRFKSLVETGEIPTIEGQPAARKGGRE